MASAALRPVAPRRSVTARATRKARVDKTAAVGGAYEVTLDAPHGLSLTDRGGVCVVAAAEGHAHRAGVEPADEVLYVGEAVCGMEDIPLQPAPTAAFAQAWLDRAQPPVHVVLLRGLRVVPPPANDLWKRCGANEWNDEEGSGPVCVDCGRQLHPNAEVDDPTWRCKCGADRSRVVPVLRTCAFG